MVFSRPIWSDTQPKKGRVRPLVMRSKVSAQASAAEADTIVLVDAERRAKLANCVITIRPPVDIIDIITNISQNTGVFSISAGRVAGRLGPGSRLRRHFAGAAARAAQARRSGRRRRR